MFSSNSMNSEPILIILDVLESLRALVLDSVMDETCSRQVTACSSSLKSYIKQRMIILL